MLPLPRSFRLSSTAIWKYQSTLTLFSRVSVAAINPYRTITMATSSRVQLSLEDCGVYHVPGISAKSAARGSDLLQENHDHYHIFFNQSGFHSTSSHLVHLPWPDFHVLGFHTASCIQLKVTCFGLHSSSASPDVEGELLYVAYFVSYFVIAVSNTSCDRRARAHTEN